MGKGKAAALTRAQAERALEWAMGHLGLQGWHLSLEWSDEVPEWADDDTYSRKKYGRCTFWLSDRTGKIWCALENCDRNGIDRLQNLMHEVAHVFLAATGYAGPDSPGREFATDRIADALAHAYRHKMKPWRK